MRMQALHRTTPTQTSGATISRTSLLWTTTPAFQVRNQMSCYLPTPWMYGPCLATCIMQQME